MSEHHRGRRWQAIAEAIKRRDGWRCTLCQRPGRLEVDHIRPVRTFPVDKRGEGPGQSDHPDNLRTLCRGCHIDVTHAQAGRPRDPAWTEMLRIYGDRQRP